MLPTKFQFIWPSGFRGEDFQKSTNQKKNGPWRPYNFMDRNEMSSRYRGPSIDASYQVLVKQFQRRRCLEMAFQPCQLTDELLIYPINDHLNERPDSLVSLVL